MTNLTEIQPDSHDEAPNELPGGWRLTRLGPYISKGTKSIVPQKTPDAAFELYSVPSFNSGIPEVLKGADIGSNKQLVDEGTVLLCKINPRINRSWVVASYSDHKKIASTEWITFPPHENFEPKYLAYYLKLNSVRDFLAGNVSGVGGSLMRVKPATLRDYPFPLAPKLQQQRIVSEIEKQFSRLDEAVANLKRVKANLKRYKAAVLKAACEGKLVLTEAELARQEKRSYETGEQLLARLLAERRKKWTGRGRYKDPAGPDNTNLPPLLEGWTWCMSDSLFSFVTSGSRGWAKHYSDSGAIFLRIGNLDHENIRLDLGDIQHVTPPTGAEGVRTMVQANDILISITADVGMVALVPDGLGEAYINQHVALARPLPPVCPRYVAYYLCGSEGGWGYFKKLQRGATKVGLGLDDIRSVPVPLPPLAEQERIVAEVERRLSVVEELEAVVSVNLQRGTRLHQAILDCSFSGRLSGESETAVA